jgi:hypothetical protein
VNEGSSDFSIQNRNEPPRDFVTVADIEVDDRQFPLGEVDRGARSGLTSGGRTEIGSKIFGISVGRETNPGYVIGGKLKGVLARREGTHVCGVTSSVNSGLDEEGNILPYLLTPNWKIADEKNKETTIWGKTKARAVLNMGHIMQIFLPNDILHVSSYWSNISRTLRTRSI